MSVDLRCRCSSLCTFVFAYFLCLDGVNCGLANQEKEFCAVFRLQNLVAMRQTLSVSLGYSKLVFCVPFTTCSFCNLREVDLGYSGRFYFKTHLKIFVAFCNWLCLRSVKSFCSYVEDTLKCLCANGSVSKMFQVRAVFLFCSVQGWYCQLLVNEFFA